MIVESPEELEKMGATPAGWPTVLVPNGGRSVATAERRGNTYYHGDRKTQVDLGGLVKVVAPAGWTTPSAMEPLTDKERPSREATGRTTEYLGRQVHGAQVPAGWSTPTAMDGRRGNQPPRPHDSGQPLPQQVAGWGTLTASGKKRSAKFQRGNNLSPHEIAGWPTVVAQDDNKTPEAHLAMKARMGGNRTAITSLQVMAKAAGWPTVRATDADKNMRTEEGAARETERKGGVQDLAAAATMAGWPTVQARDWKDGAFSVDLDTPANSMLGRVACLSRAKTDDGGALNPEFACWLMGFPQAFVWVCSVGWATRYAQKSRRSSSKPSSTSSE